MGSTKARGTRASFRLALAALLVVLAGCGGGGGKPAAVTTTTTSPVAASSSAAPAGGPVTYTVEPYDYDGAGMTMTVTQDQFGGRMCPCAKIPYPADGVHNQQGADAISAWAPHMRAGDTLMGFSLGVQVISLYLSEMHLPGYNALPAGVHVLLAGDTWNRNNVLLNTAPDAAHQGATGQGIPTDIANDVTMVVNEYDGWSDGPDKTGDPTYAAALANATDGMNRLHYYANADPNNPANVVQQYGNIRTVLVPTQHLPQNDVLRYGWNDAQVDAIDAQQRPQIDPAYTRTPSTAEQRAAAGAEQVPQPNPAWPQNPEPVVNLGG